jgi:hypothetical protein
MTEHTADVGPATRFLELSAPALFADLISKGYTSAGTDMLGRCHPTVTLFIELDPANSCALAWIWDVVAERYVGAVYEIIGVFAEAVERASLILEATLQEDSLPTKVQRFVKAPYEQCYVV